MLVLRKAVVERGQLAGVFVVDDAGVARLRLIKTGNSYGENVEVLSGVSNGERRKHAPAETVADFSHSGDSTAENHAGAEVEVVN